MDYGWSQLENGYQIQYDTDEQGCRCFNCENLLTSGDTDIDIASEEVEIRANSDDSDSDSEYEESNDYHTFDTDSITDSENDQHSSVFVLHMVVFTFVLNCFTIISFSLNLA